MNEENQTSKIWSKSLIIAMICSLCIGVSGQILNPTFPLYLVDIGIDTRYAGSMVTAFALGSFLFRPFAGVLVDTLGRKRMGLMGASTVLLAYIGFFLTDSLGVMVAIRAIQGVGFAMAFTTSGTIAADVVPRDRVSEGIGYYAMAGAVSMTIGPALGLYLYDFVPMQALFLIGTALAVTCVIALSRLSYKEPLKERKTGEKMKIKLFNKTAFLPALIMFITAFSQVALTTFLALYAKTLGIESVSIYFFLNSFGTVAARFFSGRISRRIGEQKILIVAISIVLIGQLMVSQLNGLPMLCFIGVIYGFGYGVIYPVSNSLVIKHTEPENRGSANATFTCAFDLASLIGGMAWGFVANGFGDGTGVLATGIGYSNMYIVSALLLLLTLPVIYVFKKKYGFDD